MVEEVKGLLNNLVDQSVPDEKNGDYYDDEGLICCGKCHSRKQTRLELPAGIYGMKGKFGVFHVLCKCEQEALEKRKQEEEFAEKMRDIQRRKDASMMDSVYRSASFDKYEINDQNKGIYKMATNYVQKFNQMLAENQGILIYGPVGTGKSYTAACIANALIEKHVPVIMTSFVKIMQNIVSQDEAQYMEMLNTADLLILDDLGAERNTEYALEKVYNIIDSRSRSQKPMLLTTNLELGDMMNTADIRYQRIYDRIFDTCYPVKLEGKSFRKVSASTRFERMQSLLE